MSRYAIQRKRRGRYVWREFPQMWFDTLEEAQEMFARLDKSKYRLLEADFPADEPNAIKVKPVDTPASN